MNDYEYIVSEIIESFKGNFINEDGENLYDSIKEVFPEDASIISVLNTYDDGYIYGTISISFMESIDGSMTLESINHEHIVITWCLDWITFFNHIETLAEGWVVSW